MVQKNNNELPIPVGPDEQNKRRTSRHLPSFFRTNSNKKFLGATMDVLTQPGTLTRISSYVGRRDIPNYSFDDTYIQETSTPRQYYQLEPAFINEDPVTGDVKWFGDYIDYINTLKYFGANVSNHSKFNKQEAYTWQPNIDWDKFTNYREYYWLPNGPDPIIIYGEIEATNSEFTITAEDQGDNVAYIFSPDGLTANPRITLYRGLTYTFKINTPGKPFSIKTRLETGDSYFFDIGISDRKVEQGTITFTVPYEAPDMLYYIDNNDIETAGIIDIKDIQESAELDVEKEILGKRNFTSSTGIKFINGLKLQFIGQVTPKKYLEGYWYVEGVGNKIKLVNTKDLVSPATFIGDQDVPFDDQPFDSLPWDNASSFPLTQDYIVINRSSIDKNNWSRNNRWFHRNVLETSAEANKTIAELDQSARATRPIIEFEPDIKLYNHGWVSKIDVDLVDTKTTDVFSIIEGSTGYIVDGESLLPGYRVLFTADPDILVKGKIFEVKQILNVNVNANEDITVISTSATNNTITVPSTNTLKVGQAVRFSGTVTGGLSSNLTYYIVNSNFTPDTFSVSLTKTINNNGTIVELTNSSVLTMKVSSVSPGSVQRKTQLTLQEIEETDPIDGQVVYVTKGNNYKGSSFHYQDNEWKLSQRKTGVNQAPLFDLFDEALDSYSDTLKYPFNTFSGNRIFGYKIGTGINDTVLGFPVIYRNITNIGDIEFEFDLQNASWEYVINNQLISLNSQNSYLRKLTPTGSFSYINGWVQTDRETEQSVVRILKINEPTYIVPVDVYDDNGILQTIEQSRISTTGNVFYIAKQDSYNQLLADDTYWLEFNYKTLYKGDWNSSINYSQNDLVRYKGFVYICIADPKDITQGEIPTNTLYWKLIFKGYRNRSDFIRTEDYNIDDIVRYQKETYIAIQPNRELVPTNINYWKKLVKGTSLFRGEYDSNTRYETKDIVSYGLYLYSAKSGHTGNPPTDMQYWTMLSSGSVFPEFYSPKKLYKTGDISLLDKRPKLDYRIRVYVNDKKRNDLKLEIIEGVAYINFTNELAIGDKVVYKIKSKSNKNVKGYYEIPVNWQNNPLNENVDNFTFGEVVDHVKTIVENNGEFSGDYPGISNLGNLGSVSQYGRKFMQHTGPMSLSAFLTIDKNANVIKALRWASRQYSEFKKDIITKSRLTGFDGSPREIVDQLLQFYTQSKYQDKSAFYYSDMAPFGAASVREYEVIDNRFPVFIIDSIFDPRTQTRRSILIYVNETQLLYGKDYIFDTDDAFVRILSPLTNGDKIIIKDYSSTDGCYIPFTPSKLGLYPLYEPTIYLDDTYRDPVRVIQGHDGSIVKAFGDYRDEIILEIEKRIYNSVRVEYNPDIFNLDDIITGYYRRGDFTKVEINNVLLSEFLRWNSIPKLDFNTNEYFVEEESFTYNYNKALAPNKEEPLYGYWRGIYNYFYDTDRPHSHPWEMQGFTIKPLWWDEVYGEAPYTSDNKIMWEAIEQGLINEPSNSRVNKKYARPGLSNYIPVDNQGKLLSPLESGLAQSFSRVNAKGRYSFGDQSPVETIWRRSSEYPYAIMILMCVLRGSEFIGKMWDRFTIKRNYAGQIYSTTTGKRLTPADLPFANEKQADGTRTITSGFADLIDEYVLIQKNVDHNLYKDLLRTLNVKLRYRIGGYSSKEKLKVLLDSRTPNSSGTVFLPDENYKIFYNKSAPVDTVNYSGVIIEKRTNGYSIDGYDKERNVFEILPPIISAADPAFNVGGVSESFVEWSTGKYYPRGQIARIESEFYRSKISHTSSDSFFEDIEKWQKLAKLPLTGGRDAVRRSRFKENPVRIPYGTVFTDIQSVVDFLLGYQARLRAWGFEFEEYSQDLQAPLNWLTSAKEFMFWTLQNWASGSVITLSPAANSLKFKPTITATVDNLDTDFYEYSIYKADGSPLKSDLTNIYREDNGVEIRPSSNTNEGIYHTRTNLVYAEHVLVFDNISEFNDVIYDVVPGYRQGRLKLLGYKTNQWDGSYYTPGFMYDNVEVQDWAPNVDYRLGDIVKYQNFYYAALKKVFNKSDFDFSDWTKVEEPQSKLISNFDYRVEQFRDFYSLESSNFDDNQQTLARHLIGYQPRQYLENIIVDDVSQYKFYQGFIKEKGTLNSVTKLFDALRASGFSSIDIKEEWAFKVGDFGASDAYTEIEFNLNEDKFNNNPQDIVLTLSPTEFNDQSIYNIPRTEVSKKPSSYNANPFKTKALDHDQSDYGLFKYKVAGYVKEEDVEHIVADAPSLLNYNLDLLNHRDKIWIGNTPNGEWNVVAYFNTKVFITNWEREENTLRLFCSEVPELSNGDVIAVRNIYLLDGIYTVLRTYSNVIEVYTFNNTLVKLDDESTSGVLFKFEPVRYNTASQVSVSRYNDIRIVGEKIWIDRDNQNRWKVLENKDVFRETNINPPSFVRIDNQSNGYEIKISDNKRYMFVSAIGNGSGKIVVYSRPNNKTEWAFLQTINMPSEFSLTVGGEKFGTSIDVSPDGYLLVVGAPEVSGLKTYYKGTFNTSATYEPNDVVKYNGKLWRNKNRVVGDGSTIDVNSQDWELTTDIYESVSNQPSSGLNNQGAVFVFIYDQTSRRFYERDIYTFIDVADNVPFERSKEQIISSYDPQNNEKFGSKVKLVQDADRYWLFVASENYLSGTGRVQIFLRDSTGKWTFNGQTYLDFTNKLGSVDLSYYPTIGSRYGYDIAAMHNDSKIAVSAPFLNGGAVFIFNRTNDIFELTQVLDEYTINNNIAPSLITEGKNLKGDDRFGYSLSLKNNDLFVAVPNYDTKSLNVGSVYQFEHSGDDSTVNSYTLRQIINPPSTIKNERFGMKIDTNPVGDILVVSSSGGNVLTDTTFDTYAERLVFTDDSTRNYELDPNSLTLEFKTTFDFESTNFYDRTPYTGAVYVYNKFDDDFIYGDKLRPNESLATDDNFGFAISVTDDCIVASAPKRIVNGFRYGSTYVFDYDEKSWSIKESQSEMVDISKFKKSFIYDSKENVLINNLDFYDPLKGKIPSVADQEIKYQTYYDPAIYEFGLETEVSVDRSSPWTDEHVGEVWWDLTNAKWVWYEQGDSTYRNNNWGRLFPFASIDIYEWVETPYLPSRWAQLSGTSEGSTLGISGVPKEITDFTYSTKIKYDKSLNTTTTLYYYWVKGKTTVPRTLTNFRNISIADISKLILDPKSLGYKFVGITSSNSLSLTNIGPDLKDTNVAFNVQFYEVENTELLIHREYALLAEDDANTIIPPVIENKWFDSLCGYTVKGQPVPDTRLSFRERYGSSNEPRQSWFANRFEALKQYFEYANSVLKKNQVVDDVNFTALNTAEPIPDLTSNQIDRVVDILDDLRFVGTSNIRSASLTAIVVEGRIDNILIIDSGSGYVYPPTIKISGTGTGAQLQANIDSEGRVTSVTIIKAGKNYDSYSTELRVRNHTILVLSDEDALGGWSLHEWSGVKKSWNRFRTQAYNVPRYWSYVDWYAEGYDQYSEINFQVDQTVNLNGILAQVGDIVKVNDVNNTWLLLKRIAITESPDFTEDYEVIGRQNATIQFSDKLYNLNRDLGFDTKFSFDLILYDQTPTVELRIILESIKNDIFTDNLRQEYIKLFFNSVHYSLHEHLYVNWVFKTSFLKINHNVGSLKQRITFQSDELESYQQYIEEVKPYKSKIREFVSSYNVLDPANEQVTDFDLFSYYNNNSGRIERTTKFSSNINLYPWKDWLDNNTYEVVDIEIYDNGNNYTSVPKVIITGDGRDAAATAYIANGKVYRIIVDDPGSGYTTAPTVFISGGNGDIEEYRAKAVAKIGNSKVRTNIMQIKYDRTSPVYTVNEFTYTDRYSGNNITRRFKLTYAPDTKKINFNILVNNVEIYGSQYSIEIIEVLHDTYKTLEGYINFETAPGVGTNNVVITYHKNIRLLQASDRINYAYNPTSGMYGKDLGQLMTGVDYGGVQLQSIDFEIGGGWDVLPWDTSSWDNVLSTNDDYVIASDGTTRSFDLPYIPSVGEVINIYNTRVVFDENNNIVYDGINPKTVTTRLDDPYFSQYDGSTEQPNGLTESPLGTIMDSFVGDGINKTITIPITYDLLVTDVITLRKSTSDGTILPTDRSLIDSFVDGGDLTYNSAKGILADEIVLDGDGLVTVDTSHGPEELVQGQVVDALDIKVYHTPSNGGPNVVIKNYTGDGVTDTYDIGQPTSTVGGIFVILGGTLLLNVEDSSLPDNDSRQFKVNFIDGTITITEPPVNDEKLAIISIDTAGYDVTEKVTFVGDGVTTEYLMSSRWNNGDITAFVTVNGVSSTFFVKESDDQYVVPGNVVVQFETAPLEGDLIQITMFRGTIKKWSEVTTQHITIDPTNYIYELDPKPANLGPLSATAFVIIDGEFLQAPDFEFFIYDGSVLSIPDLRYPPNTLTPQDIDVYKNGVKLIPVADYTINSTNSSVSLNDGVAELGDEITIEIYKSADYRIDIKDIEGTELSNLSIIIDSGKYQLNNKKVMRITTFTNHDIIRIKTSNLGFKFNTGYDVLQYDIVQYDIINDAMNTSGIFDLPRTVGNNSGVFVALNRKLLAPNVEYVVLDSKNQIKVLLPDDLKGSDYIQIITFDDKTIQPSYGFRIFKDMINRYSYKRLDRSTTAFLTQPLTYLDTRIIVNNGDILPIPNRSLNLPGVIEIDGERIEYLVKEGNTLRQLRRGTLGTGIKDFYEVGTQVNDLGVEQTLPYRDVEVKKTFYSDGTSRVFELDFIPTVKEGTVEDGSTIVSDWHRDTIPWNFGQCDQIEVFVAGKRLRKAPITVYDQELGQDSYNGAGDKPIEAEFSVDGITPVVRLTEVPAAGDLIVVVYKTGRLWQKMDENVSLVFSPGDIANFLRAKQVNLPK